VRVKGLGLPRRVQDLGFRGVKVRGLAFRVQGFQRAAMAQLTTTASTVHITSLVDVSKNSEQVLGVIPGCLVPSLIEGLRVVQGLRVVPVFLYRYSMIN
jgi:hypothetical protein